MRGDSEPGKIFIGGLSYDTSDHSLTEYFRQFGELKDSVVMKEKDGKPRGFGFVTFVDAGNADVVLSQPQGPHLVDGKAVDVKRCVGRDEAPAPRAGGGGRGGFESNYGGRGGGRGDRGGRGSYGGDRGGRGGFSSGGPMRGAVDRTKNKVFVGGLPAECSDRELRMTFERFGPIKDIVVMTDAETGRSKGFGFVTFDSDDSVERATVEQYISIMNKKVEVKRAKEGGREGGAGDAGRGGFSPRGRGAPRGRGGYGGSSNGNYGGYGGQSQGQQSWDAPQQGYGQGYSQQPQHGGWEQQQPPSWQGGYQQQAQSYSSEQYAQPQESAYSSYLGASEQYSGYQTQPAYGAQSAYQQPPANGAPTASAYSASGYPGSQSGSTAYGVPPTATSAARPAASLSGYPTPAAAAPSSAPGGYPPAAGYGPPASAYNQQSYMSQGAGDGGFGRTTLPSDAQRGGAAGRGRGGGDPGAGRGRGAPPYHPYRR